MTTKPPSTVRPALASSNEAVAYASVQDIMTVDPHDRDRLAYNVWRWLTTRKDSLEMAVRSAGARLVGSEAEAIQKIRQNLQKQGIQLD
jgi:hypothetical protein